MNSTSFDVWYHLFDTPTPPPPILVDLTWLNSCRLVYTNDLFSCIILFVFFFSCWSRPIGLPPALVLYSLSHHSIRKYIKIINMFKEMFHLLFKNFLAWFLITCHFNSSNPKKFRMKLLSNNNYCLSM